ncbi:MAG: PEGA domain-containing protein [Myxococcaceae bacterium]|nr:PEGA domain-containing protein [Myxococcaceae bacterium]
MEQVGYGALAVAVLALAGQVLLVRVEQARDVAAPPSGPDRVIAPTVLPEGLSWADGPGQVLTIVSEPDGADVTIDGQPYGQTPFSSDFPACASGQLKVGVERRGHQRVSFEVPCRSGQTSVRAVLKKTR